MVMESNSDQVLRYRAKAARRPVLFWWQAFMVLGSVVFLWSLLPMAAIMHEERIVPPLPDAYASYVVLDPHVAAMVLKKMQTAWALGAAGGKLSQGAEIDLIERNDALRPPVYLKQGARYPGVWQPAAVEPLPQRLPALRVPSPADPVVLEKGPPEPHGIFVSLGESLKSGAFSFPVPEERLPEKSGHCRFYVETDADGSVAHLLLLSPRSAAAAVLERFLFCGRSQGAARGFVDVHWVYVKS